MLHELHIEDLGVIETLDLVLGAGLTALTGETGAGKTMLVEAINLLVGGRADAAIVRTGRRRGARRGPLRRRRRRPRSSLARVVPADGRSRAYVNGRLATVGRRSPSSARDLVDLHGQHAHQSLLGGGRAARGARPRSATSTSRRCAPRVPDLTEIDAELAALGGDERARAREIDLLRFQVERARRAPASTDADEDAQLEAEEDTAGRRRGPPAGGAAARRAALPATAARVDAARRGDRRRLGHRAAVRGDRSPA